MRKQNTPKTAQRKKRLPQVYYDTGERLRNYLFTEDDIGESKKKTARQLIARLAELSGVEYRELGPAQGWAEERTLKEASRVFHFDMPEDDPRRPEWQRTFDALGDIADLARRYYNAKERAKKAAGLNPTNAPR